MGRHPARGQRTRVECSKLAGHASEVERIDDTSVNVHFNISEGQAARIKEINIVGNEVYTDEELLRGFDLTTPTWTSWFTKDDQYSKQKLQGDLENLRSRYVDNGYIYFNVDSTQVSITPDRRQVYITIGIREGDVYTVNEVNLVGELGDIRAEDLRALFVVSPGQTFSQGRITATEDRMEAALGNGGFTFATANGVTKINDDGTVDFADINAVLAAWGPCDECPEDINRNGAVEFGDINALLVSWGECP